MKIVTTGAYSKVIKDDDGKPVGQALLLANGRWAPFSLGDERLINAELSFRRPQDVLAFFKAARS